MTAPMAAAIMTHTRKTLHPMTRMRNTMEKQNIKHIPCVPKGKLALEPCLHLS